MSNTPDDPLQVLSDFRTAFQQAQEEHQRRIEEKWNALSKEDQLDYFCAVVKRIHQGEVEEQRSYRGMLYGIFGFGPESYAVAQMSGYLDLHNLIYAPDYERRLLAKYGEYVAEQLKVDLPDPNRLVVDFYHTHKGDENVSN